jgi:bacterioferritin
MKGNEKLLAVLNQLLAEELTAVHQYMVHSEMCANWGYEKLHKAIEKQAVDEMRHAKWLIRHLLFLEGTPIVSQLDPMRIGKVVPKILANDQAGELSAVKAYNEAIRLAREVGDHASVKLLTKILKMEVGHADWGQVQRSQIEQMGLESYLANQNKGA